MSEAIYVEGLSKAYNGKTVLNKLDLSVKSGTVFGLLGATALCSLLAVRFFRWE